MYLVWICILEQACRTTDLATECSKYLLPIIISSNHQTKVRSTSNASIWLSFGEREKVSFFSVSVSISISIRINPYSINLVRCTSTSSSFSFFFFLFFLFSSSPHSPLLFKSLSWRNTYGMSHAASLYRYKVPEWLAWTWHSAHSVPDPCTSDLSPAARVSILWAEAQRPQRVILIF